VAGRLKAVGARIGVALLLVVVGLPALATAVAGQCSNPVLLVEPQEPGVGDDITVSGTGFGDGCEGDGVPDAGGGEQGNPLKDIEIVVRQGEEEHLVAAGRADADYEFEVVFPLPPSFGPGVVTMVVTTNRERVFEGGTEMALQVQEGGTPAPPGGAVEVVAFGPVPGAAQEAVQVTGSSGEDDRRPVLLAAVGVVVLLLVARAGARRAEARRARARQDAARLPG
jgi:hypothetical protein